MKTLKRSVDVQGIQELRNCRGYYGGETGIRNLFTTSTPRHFVAAEGRNSPNSPISSLNVPLAAHKISTILLCILALGMLVGCGHGPTIQHAGYVRSVYFGRIITFEWDDHDHQVDQIEFCSLPAVWVGMHAAVEFRWEGEGDSCYELVSVKRLP